MTTVSEIAPGLFRISTFVSYFNLQFNQFLVRDDEPLLFHAGPHALFMAVRDAVATCSTRTSIVSSFCTRRTCRTAGKRGCCSK
jgi:hypothetical protein